MSPSPRRPDGTPRPRSRRAAEAPPPAEEQELDERWARLGDFIRHQRNQAELSVRRLSELSGVSNPYLSQIERGLKKPSAEILLQIAKALSIAPSALYRTAGLLDHDVDSGDEPPPPGVIEAIQLDPTLSADQKASLIQVYESFLRAR